jgi:hypothetical protein
MSPASRGTARASPRQLKGRNASPSGLFNFSIGHGVGAQKRVQRGSKQVDIAAVRWLISFALIAEVEGLETARLPIEPRLAGQMTWPRAHQNSLTFIADC